MPSRRWALVLAMPVPPAQAADTERGRALYEGRVAMSTVGASPMPAACAACHRPSGMGNFEGGLAVPPIAGPMLFEPLDRDTARFFPASARWRVRPAYDEASLGRLLRSGESPDGVTLQPAMPRYRIDDADLADLSAYLRTMSQGTPPGLDADTVRVATVTTPDADPRRRDAMLATVQHFIAQKNGQSRHEGEALGAVLAHARDGHVPQVPHLAARALGAAGRRFDLGRTARCTAVAPAGVCAGGGHGRRSGRPSMRSARGTACPACCRWPGSGGGRAPGYGLHFHAGIDADAAMAASRLKALGLRRALLWGTPGPLADRVRGVFAGQGVALDDGDSEAPAIVSLLPPAAHAARLRPRAATAFEVVAWLPGTHALGRAELDASLPQTQRGWIVTPMRTGEPLDRRLQRTRLWLRDMARGSSIPVDVAASTLQAATVLGEGLVHLDFGFTPEYLLELLEHGLENVIPWSPFSARLAIGPDQRIASKGSWVGEVREGRVALWWRALP